MRKKNTIINASLGVILYVISFFPVFWVRKLFIENIGVELLGLTSLYTNIIGYLSIVEMGIGSAIIYSLYKPFAEKNFSKVKGYIKFYQRFYVRAGILILIIGLGITPFIHLAIRDKIDISLIRSGFLLVLLNTIIGYMFTYKHCILTVAQEGYKVSVGITMAKILTAVFQVIIIVEYKNYYLYLLVQAVVNLIFYILINKYIDKKFLWLKEEIDDLDINEKKGLYKNIKALFCHKIGEILVLGTDNLVVATFISIKMVAIYNNYILITNACIAVVKSAMGGITASIGNLLVEKDKEYAYIIHEKLFFITFWIASFVVISLFNTIDHFIILWVGELFLLDIFTLSIILINLYFFIMRGPVEQFKNASGEYYKDRFAPLFEGGINLVSSVMLVKLIGLPGVFIGTLLSNILVIFWVQPKIIYKYVFEKPLINYFKMYFKYIVIGLVPLSLTVYLTRNIKLIGTPNMFILNCIINIVTINIVYLIIFWKNEKFIYFKNIFLNMINEAKKRLLMKFNK